MAIISSLKSVFSRVGGWMETHEPPFTPPSFDSLWIVVPALITLLLGLALHGMEFSGPRQETAGPAPTMDIAPGPR